MLAGDPYLADDPQIASENRRAMDLSQRYNATSTADAVERQSILTELLGSFGVDSVIRPPFYCDYGFQTHIGARVFVNFGLVALDVARIVIGDDVKIGPNTQLLTPLHPLDPGLRLAKWESSAPVTIGDNVWLAGGVIVCPGVTIGSHTVVGAGSVVTRDLPSGVLAMGSPARVVRDLPAPGDRPLPG